MHNSNYVQMLQEEFEGRKKRRPQYSERAFARDLDLSSGFISLLFNGKRSLSPRTSMTVIEKLNWSEADKKCFIELVQAEQLKKQAPTKSKTKIIETDELEKDHFLFISHLDHFAVLELIQNHEVSSLSYIANKLNVDEESCEEIVDRLFRLGFVEKFENKLVSPQKNRKLRSTPSQAIRNYHRQCLEMAIDSIEEQDFKKRDLRGLTLSIDPKDFPEAQKTIERFFKNFNKKFGNTKNGEIYQFNTQLFSHSQKEE